MAKPEPQPLAQVPRGGADSVAEGPRAPIAPGEQRVEQLGERHTERLGRTQPPTRDEAHADPGDHGGAERNVKESYVREVLNAPRFKVPLPGAFAGAAPRRAGASPAGSAPRAPTEVPPPAASSPTLELALDSVPTAPPRPVSDPAGDLHPTGLAARLLLQADPVRPLPAISAKVDTAGIFDVTPGSEPGLTLEPASQEPASQEPASQEPASQEPAPQEPASFSDEATPTHVAPPLQASSSGARGALEANTTSELEPRFEAATRAPGREATARDALAFDPSPRLSEGARGLEAEPQWSPALERRPARKLETSPAFEPLIDPLAVTSLSPFALSTEPQRVAQARAKRSSWGLLSAVFVLVCASVLALGQWYSELNRPAPLVTESRPLQESRESVAASAHELTPAGKPTESSALAAEPLRAGNAVRFEDLPSAPAASAPAETATPTTAAASSGESSRTSDESKIDPGTTATPTSAERGTLSINSLPASAVFINGRRLGYTPQLAVSLPPGKHRVTLQHDELGTHSMNLTVEAGKKRVISHKF